MNKLIGFAVALSLTAVVTLPTVAGAGEPDQEESRSTFVVQGADGEEITVSIADGAMTMVSKENGKTSTRIVDLEAMGLLAADAVEEALTGMEDVFAELQDLQLQFRLGQDNRLNVSCDDTEFELDLDQVMAQVASAVQVGLQELETSEWTSRRDRQRNVSDGELRHELSDLKAEMEALRAELNRLRETKED